MNNELITIVVPIYNVERYLEKCLTSIILQTYKNLEIILVNDGSTDNSLKICEEFKKNDDRIKIINQKNAGLSAARNTGINEATGEYIAFIDSDDFVSCKFIENLYKEALKNNCDIVCCDFYYINEIEKKWYIKEKENKVYTSIEAIKDIFIGKQNTEVMTWNKLYRLELFNKYDIRFPVGKLNEDNFTTYKLYYYSNTISLINDKLYYYLQRKNSIMNTSFNKKRLDILDSISEVKTFFSDKSVNLENEIKAYEYFTKVNLLNVMIRENYDKETRDNLIKSMKKKDKSLRKNKCISIKFKFVLIMIRNNIKMYEKLLLLKDKLQKRKIKIIK